MQLRLWNLNITLVMTSLPLARVFLTAQSTGSHRGIVGGIQIPETLLQAPERPGELARRLGQLDLKARQSAHARCCLVNFVLILTCYS